MDVLAVKLKNNEPELSEFEIRRIMATACNLRRQGHDYPHIAKTLGCSTNYAKKLVKIALREVTADSVEELIKQESERLDAVFLPAFLEATRTDGKGDPVFSKEATDSVIKIMERRARFFGLDKPSKTELSGELGVFGSKPIQIYIPDNKRGLPAGLTIENGEIVETTKAEPIDDLIFIEPELDLTELAFDLYKDAPNIEVIETITL